MTTWLFEVSWCLGGFMGGSGRGLLKHILLAPSVLFFASLQHHYTSWPPVYVMSHLIFLLALALSSLSGSLTPLSRPTREVPCGEKSQSESSCPNPHALYPFCDFEGRKGQPQIDPVRLPKLTLLSLNNNRSSARSRARNPTISTHFHVVISSTEIYKIHVVTTRHCHSACGAQCTRIKGFNPRNQS